jgi:hypothetical protein
VAGFDEFYETEPKTIEEFRDSVWEYEADDRATEAMCATAEWVAEELDRRRTV